MDATPAPRPPRFKFDEDAAYRDALPCGIETVSSCQRQTDFLFGHFDGLVWGALQL